MSTISDAARSVQSFGEAISDAATASVKQNQELAGKAFQAWIGLVGGSLRATDAAAVADNVTTSVATSFGLAKEALEAHREIAEKFLASAYATAK